MACGKSYLKKRGSKCPPNAKLLACGLAFTRPFSFLPSLARACLCHIARSDDIDIFCSHITQMRSTTIALRAMTHDGLIFMLYHDERTTIIQFFHRIACASKQASNDHVVLRRASQCTLYRDERMILLSFAREAKHFSHVVSREATATSVFFTSYPIR